jgi:hypothetical protein
MAFRNPLTSLPASAITGQIVGTQITDGAITTPKLAVGAITADKIDANALNGKTITGSVVQTAASGNRVVITSGSRGAATAGEIDLYTGDGGAPAVIAAYGSADGTTPGLKLTAPGGTTTPPDIWLQYEGESAHSRIDLTADTVYALGAVDLGVMSAANMAWGSASITPVANTDTSVTVSGVGLRTGLGIYRVWLLANTGSPGQINAVTATGATADGFTLWINRTVATTTNVWWLMLAK